MMTYDGRALPLELWPEQDRKAWANACGGKDNLLDENVASGWRDSSKELFVRCYGMWLKWLKSEGLLEFGEAPTDRVTPSRVVAYLKNRRSLGNNARTLVNHAVSLRHMFEAFEPTRDWTWMLKIIRKLKTAVAPTNRPATVVSIEQLFGLGMALMAGADKDNHRGLKRRAISYRNGLAIAILASRPLMRRNNLAGIRIGKHLLKEGDVYRLEFSGDEMKGRRARGGPLPHVLTERIDRYLSVYRPALLGAKPDTSQALLLSTFGLPIYPKALSHEIGKITEAIFDRRITTHPFRHVAGSSIAKEDPEHVGIVTTILGHADYRTSERYYIIADEQAAFRRYHRLIAQLEAD